MSHIGPAIAAAQERTQVVLVDRCTVRRDPEGTRDDVLDDDTLSYGDTTDAVVAHADVPCKFDHELRNGAVGEAGQPTVISEYKVAFAADADVREGDELEVTASPHDPGLVGRSVVIVEVMRGTFAVLQRCRARMRTGGVDLP